MAYNTAHELERLRQQQTNLTGISYQQPFPETEKQISCGLENLESSGMKIVMMDASYVMKKTRNISTG